jgi:hypothetical protein
MHHLEPDKEEATDERRTERGKGMEGLGVKQEPRPDTTTRRHLTRREPSTFLYVSTAASRRSISGATAAPDPGPAGLAVICGTGPPMCWLG